MKASAPPKTESFKLSMLLSDTRYRGTSLQVITFIMFVAVFFWLVDNTLKNLALLGKYVRDEKVISLEEAIKKLTYNPAKTLKIKNRGLLKKGYYADIVIFDKDKIKDFSTFSNSHQFSTGVIHVFVNGTQVLKDGEHTGALPGRFIKGPGYKK